MSFEWEAIHRNGRPVPGFEPTAGPCPHCPLPWPFLAAEQLAWVRTSAIKPGDRVRVAIDAAGLTAIAALAKQLGVTDIDLNGLITNPELVKFWPLQGTDVKTWAPNQQLPPDWPSEDASVANEYRAELTYSGKIDLDSTNLAKTWVAKGLGLQSCSSDSDCPSGQTCVNGKCTPQQPPPEQPKGMSTAAVAGIALAAVAVGGLIVWAAK
jgi:hypothetical protein